MKLKYGAFLLLYFLISLHSLQAQSLLKSFCRLSGPEKCWTIGHLFTARKAFSITEEARRETALVLKDSLLDQWPSGGKSDAFRHCYWMARLSQDLGSKRARSLGKAHEKGNYKDFKKAKLEEGFLPDSVSGVMDLLNNEKGILIGENNRDSSAQRIKNIVIDQINEGLLVILKRNEKGILTDCNGYILAYYRPTWALPYCIISSSTKQ